MAIPVLGLAEIGLKLIDQLWDSEEEKAEKKFKLMQLASQGQLQELAAQSQIVTAVAKSEHWLTSTWRPITMLSLVAMLWAYWLGMSPPNVSDEVLAKVFSIIQVGLGGYVVGRSAEKVVRVWKEK